MSKKEGFRNLDTQNAATAGDKGARNLPQTVGRKKLADISNLPQNQRPLIQENKPQFIDATMKEYIEQLKKENMGLVKMLAQRNKIIEQSGAELDRLRVNMAKMQEQNQQLALSNSRMLLELNSVKERLKVFQHDLGCKSGLLKARKLELEDKERKELWKNADAEEEGESSKSGDEEKGCKATWGLQSNSSGNCNQLQSEQKIECKRHSVRRQSTRFKVAEPQPAEKSFKTDDTKVPTSLPDISCSEKGSSSENSLVKNENNNGTSEQRYESLKSERSSRLRPTRQAAGKVQSYKEMPINIKMRRPE